MKRDGEVGGAPEASGLVERPGGERESRASKIALPNGPDAYLADLPGRRRAILDRGRQVGHDVRIGSIVMVSNGDDVHQCPRIRRGAGAPRTRWLWLPAPVKAPSAAGTAAAVATRGERADQQGAAAIKGHDKGDRRVSCPDERGGDDLSRAVCNVRARQAVTAGSAASSSLLLRWVRARARSLETCIWEMPSRSPISVWVRLP